MTQTNGLPKGIIFDMDGVLLDSEAFICKAAMMMFAEHGLRVHAEDFKPFIGTGEDRFIGGVAEKYNFAFDIERDKKCTYEIYLDIIKGQLDPLPGTLEFIDLCKKMDKKIAIASSADRCKIEGNLTEIGLSLKIFDAVLTGNDIEHKKPAPDIFLAAAEQIGLDAAQCLVVEDAVSGVTAAKAAGAKCLAITSSFSIEQLKDADFFAADLSAVPEGAIKWQ